MNEPKHYRLYNGPRCSKCGTDYDDDAKELYNALVRAKEMKADLLNSIKHAADTGKHKETIDTWVKQIGLIRHLFGDKLIK